MKEQTPQQRTTTQNRALHKLFGDIANYCVETGLDQKAVVNGLSSYAVPVSPQSVKEIWRTIQYTLTGKVSTTELTTKEIDQVYDVFNKFWSELTGEHFAFPSFTELMLNNYDDQGNLKQ